MSEDAFWSRPAWTGVGYHGALKLLHKALRPEVYLEIGVSKGVSLEHASCASIAVDPNFKLDREVVGQKPACLFFQSTSDDFFRDFDPVVLLGRRVDLAFLDGLHEYEALLRDFRNTERSCKPDSVILLHDCLPVDSHVGRREPDDRRYRSRTPNPDHWAGDVWKAAYVLTRARPDLKILTFDCPPTGLVAVTRLAPHDPPPDSVYAPHLAEVADFTLATHGDAYYESLVVQTLSRDAEAGWLVDLLRA